MSALVPLGQRKEDFREAITTTAVSHRADAGPALTFVGARFVIVRATRDQSVLLGSVFASTDGESLTMASAQTRAAADDIAMQFGSGAMILAIQPSWSFPAERWVQADTDFWQTSPAARTRRDNSVATDRLTLRAPRADDAASLVRLMTPDISRWLATWPAQVDLGEARRRILEAQHDLQSGRAMHWVIEHRERSLVLGWIRISRLESDASRGELGFWLGASFHGMGYATEAARAALRAAAPSVPVPDQRFGRQRPKSRSSWRSPGRTPSKCRARGFQHSQPSS
jgi:RimJ/RimL family protein N-acetyltransferase